MARPKLADVAKLAGVGIGTASDALAGKNRIPEETRARVRQAADALGYVPNPLARAMTAGRLPVIGVVMTAFRHPAAFEPYRGYWGELVGSAAMAAIERGYAVTVVPGVAQVLESALPVAGLVVITTHEDEDDFDRALRLGVPVVGDAFVEDPRAAGWVSLDYGITATMVMDHFVEQGAQRPALLWGLYGDSLLGRVAAAYRTWCDATGHEQLDACTDPGNDLLEAGVHDLLDRGADAILTVVESVPQIVSIIEGRGLRVGTDVRLVTLDEDVSGRLADAQISTITLTGGNYAETVVGALIDAIEGKAPTPIVIRGNPTLHPRASSTGTA